MRLLLDLDGTLTDPFPGITKSIQHALVALGHPPPAAESLRWCIGPPLKQSFATLLGPAHAHLTDAALAHYRERFGTVGLFENDVYPGIDDALDRLVQSGHDLQVATSKPTVFAVRIIAYFKLQRYFRSVDGSELDGTRSDKAHLLAHLLQRDAIAPGDAIMIGDREHDVIGARANGLRSLGVLWGYGSEGVLRAAGAAACVGSPGDLAAAVSKQLPASEMKQAIYPPGADGPDRFEPTRI